MLAKMIVRTFVMYETLSASLLCGVVGQRLRLRSSPRICIFHSTDMNSGGWRKRLTALTILSLINSLFVESIECHLVLKGIQPSEFAFAVIISA